MNQQGETKMQKSRWTKKATAATMTLLILTVTYLTYGQSAVFNNPGLLINTSGDDYSPSCTSDGRTIVFSSRNEEETTHKIYTCTNSGGVWSEPYPLLELSSESNDETPFISGDGQILLFSSDRPGGLSPSATADNNKRITYDIYISRMVNGKWSLPELVAGDVNTNMNERSPSLSADGRTIFFARFPYRNISKAVLYMASWNDGKFTDVRALPESVNSGNYELSFVPSYIKEGVYYFASRRGGGYGGWDIYYTTMSDTGFSEPVNAGDGVNSRFDELYYTETEALRMFCSNRTGGFGGYDLYVSGTVKYEGGTQWGGTEGLSGLKFTVKDKSGGGAIPGAEVSVYRQLSSDDGNQTGRWEVLTCDSRGELVIKTSPEEHWVMVRLSGKDYKGKTIRIKIAPGKMQDIELIAERQAESGTDKIGEIKKEYHGTDSKTDSKKETRPAETTCMDLPELKPVYFGFNST